MSELGKKTRAIGRTSWHWHDAREGFRTALHMHCYHFHIYWDHCCDSDNLWGVTQTHLP